MASIPLTDREPLVIRGAIVAALTGLLHTLVVLGVLPIDPEADPTLVRVRWMLEELRVGLFAQELRTAETVSVQRIRKALAG